MGTDILNQKFKMKNKGEKAGETPDHFLILHF